MSSKLEKGVISKFDINDVPGITMIILEGLLQVFHAQKYIKKQWIRELGVSKDYNSRNFKCLNLVLLHFYDTHHIIYSV